MKLLWVELENFRCYNNATRIIIDDITAFIGRNDSGKSSVFDALNIFFGSTKIDEEDRCKYGDGSPRITCAFSGFPEEIVLDDQAKTSLKSEFLLDQNNNLVISKTYENSREKTCILAYHPTTENADKLHDMTIDQLKKLAITLNIPVDKYDARIKSQMRSAIWDSFGRDLKLISKEIPIDKGDSKSIYEKLKPYLPQYFLFKSDRENLDNENEAQDPIKVAISSALLKHKDALAKIKSSITAEVEAVTTKTLVNLATFDAQLAASLVPDLKKEPDWKKVFEYSISDDNGVPINKRGSGVRRLVLFSFLRTKIDEDDINQDMIFAVEEPETSQHPDFQKMFIAVLKDLSNKPNIQIMLTTHVPGLSEELDTSALRFIRAHKSDSPTIETESTNPAILEDIAKTLGVYSKYSISHSSIKLLFCVEGPNDISFWENISLILNSNDSTYISLRDCPEVVLLPMGGATLKNWADRNYLEKLHIPELHVYDRDDDCKYKQVCEDINSRGTSDFATLTNKREIENYIHPEAIRKGYAENGTLLSIPDVFLDTDDVPAIIAKAAYESNGSSSWDDLSSEKKQKKENQAKKTLNSICTKHMTADLLISSDPGNEIIKILHEVNRRIN